MTYEGLNNLRDSLSAHKKDLAFSDKHLYHLNKNMEHLANDIEYKTERVEKLKVLILTLGDTIEQLKKGE